MSLFQKNQRFFASTRGQIILLLRRAAHTVDELARVLHLTDNAVRAHLTTLERDGLVTQQGVRRGNSKPSSVYQLAPEAESLFPKAYDTLLRAFLAILHENMALNDIEALTRRVGQHLASQWQIPAGELELRLQAVVAILNELGGLAEVERRDERYVIQGYSCPFASVVPDHPEVCRLAETMLTTALGSPIHACCQCEETARCLFVVESS